MSLVELFFVALPVASAVGTCFLVGSRNPLLFLCVLLPAMLCLFLVASFGERVDRLRARHGRDGPSERGGCVLTLVTCMMFAVFPFIALANANKSAWHGGATVAGAWLVYAILLELVTRASSRI